MTRHSILIIDDNEELCRSLKRNFDSYDWETHYALTAGAGISYVASTPVDVILVDVVLRNEDGLIALRELKKLAPKVPVVMITGFGTVASAVTAIKIGAYDYIMKPLDFHSLLTLCVGAAELPHRPRTSPEDISQVLRDTKSTRLLELLDTADKVAATDLPLMILGESGTGKELLAEYVHQRSIRSSRSMTKINCSAFSETLLENELFGHERGSYTGADSRSLGLIESSQQSTIFFDEIGDMPLTIQSKLLRVMQNKEVRRIGSSKTITVDFRFIGATNKDLTELLMSKSLRQDFFYRINGASIEVPPLRERKEDLHSLVNRTVREFNFQYGTQVAGVSDEAFLLLENYDWPGTYESS